MRGGLVFWTGALLLFLTPTLGWALTPLSKAVREGKLKEVQQLVASGHGVNEDDEKGYTPIHYAAEFDQLSILQFLVKEGANVQERTRLGSTPLHFAAAEGTVETIRYLISKGARPELKNQAGETAVLWAATAGNTNTLEYLMERGATVDDSIRLLLACSLGDHPTAASLIQAEGKVNIRGRNGLTPLFLAAQSSNLALVQLLVNHKANLKVRVNKGMSALHFAGSAEVARFLMEHGLRPQEKNMLGIYPLHTAAEAGRLDVVALFIELGAPVNLTSLIRMTPLHFASENGHLELVEWLMSHGANPNARTLTGKTPADLALNQGHQRIAEKLK